jgi:integrase
MAHPEQMTSPLVTTEIEALVTWCRDLRARNLAPETIKTYGESADQVVAHLDVEGVTMAGDGAREQVSDFITDLLATRSASTATVRFRALQQFFAWLVDEEQIATSPMARLRPPKIPEQLTPVLDDAAIRALLKAWQARSSAPSETRPSCACSWTRGWASTSSRSSGPMTSTWTMTTRPRSLAKSPAPHRRPLRCQVSPGPRPPRPRRSFQEW